MKKLIGAILISGFTTASAQAQNVNSAKSISCSSNAFGSFVLKDLDTASPTIVNASVTPLKVNSKTKNSITFTLVNGAKLTMSLDSNLIAQEKVGRSLYSKYQAEILDGAGGIFAAQCLVEEARR